jgi:pimeloyl-ACP methyl ester carboxylesterase
MDPPGTTAGKSTSPPTLTGAVGRSVLERGKGRTVVFLHGYPLHHGMWLPQLESLSHDHRVLLVDLPGFGLAADEVVPDSLAGFAQRVHATLVQQRAISPLIVGHSFGGYVALQLYHDHPELFAGLVLADTRSGADSAEAREKRMALVQRLEKSGEFLDVDETVRGLLAPATWEAQGPVVDQVRNIVREARPPALRGSLRAMAGRPDHTATLATIEVPALVIWGEEDHLIPPAQSQSMVPTLRAGEGVGIARAGHLPSLESPVAFDGAVRSLLRRIPGE